ncbi:MAG: hypothetical protein AAB903_02005 [Patescibacteria group bacterium]
MSRQSAFIKVSGDLCAAPEFLEFLRITARDYFAVVCVGGGTQINEALKKAGFVVQKHGPLGRETSSFEERQLARDVLETNQAILQDKLKSLGIPVTVVIPVLEIASVLCHVNGDQMVRTVYLGFDKLYIITMPDRAEEKAKQFADLPKVEVVSLMPF